MNSTFNIYKTYILIGGLMKNIFNYFFLISLVFFSFFYTDKVINIINKKDPLMVEITKQKDKYKVEPTEAIITENTVIPGIEGKEIDVDKSYEKMKTEGVFREQSIIYNKVTPTNSISNNKDKYIIKGNNNKQEVSIIVIVDKNNTIDKIYNIDNITLFIDSKYLTIDNLNKIKSKDIYSYGNKGVYNNELLLSDNTLIKRKNNKVPLYCLSKEKNEDTLNICNNNDMYVVIPNVVGDLLNIKKSLSKGSIILLEDLNNINLIIRYINSKGYQIVPLSTLLKE